MLLLIHFFRKNSSRLAFILHFLHLILDTINVNEFVVFTEISVRHYLLLIPEQGLTVTHFGIEFFTGLGTKQIFF